MSTPKTLRELVKAATPGPRFINDLGFTPVRVSSGTIMNATGLYATFDAGDYAQTREQGFANAALCCRLSPEVVLEIHDVLTDLKNMSVDEGTSFKAARILSALNGVTDANNQKTK